MNKSYKSNWNGSTQQMFQVVPPNSTENATFNDFCILRMIQLPEKNPSQQLESAKQVLSHAHLMQLIKFN